MATRTTAKSTRSTTPKTTISAESKAPKVETSSEDASTDADFFTPDGDLQELTKKELIDRVVDRSGVKKRDAKPAVEAALAVLGEALAEGRELRLPSFGKMKVSKIKAVGNKRVIVSRIRQDDTHSETPDPAPADPLATAAE